MAAGERALLTQCVVLSLPLLSALLPPPGETLCTGGARDAPFLSPSSYSLPRAQGGTARGETPLGVSPFVPSFPAAANWLPAHLLCARFASSPLTCDPPLQLLIWKRLSFALQRKKTKASLGARKSDWGGGEKERPPRIVGWASSTSGGVASLGPPCSWFWP